MNKVDKKRICSRDGCKNIFEYKRRDQKYCCLSCSKIKLVPINCKNKKCSNFFMPLDGRQVYCSKNCAASVNNLNYDRHNRKNSTKFYCKNCSNLLDTSRKYCDIDCQYELLVKNWYSGEWSGSTQNGLSQTIRNHLLKKANFKCQDGRSNCQNWGMINPKSGKSCLQVEHIDGHYENNRPENLIVICPNCHSMTETYGGLNKGNGRPYRYKLK